MSAAWNSALSYGAQGAATGASFGGAYGAAIGGAIGFVGGFITGGANQSAFDNQQAWARYNQQMAYQTEQSNLNMSLMANMMNMSLNANAAAFDAQRAMQNAAYNAQMIQSAVSYRNSLLMEDEERLWESVGLDIAQIKAARERERGEIIANQGASGTVIGEGSNAEVVIDQMTQEQLDILVVERGAEIAAAGIENEIAANVWNGQVAMGQAIWDGQQAAQQSIFRAQTQNLSSAANAFLQYSAGTYSNEQALYTGNLNLMNQQMNFDNASTQQMVQGLFTAGSTAVQGYYMNKVPQNPQTANTAKVYQSITGGRNNSLILDNSGFGNNLYNRSLIAGG